MQEPSDRPTGVGSLLVEHLHTPAVSLLAGQALGVCREPLVMSNGFPWADRQILTGGVSTTPPVFSLLPSAQTPAQRLPLY